VRSQRPVYSFIKAEKKAEMCEQNIKKKSQRKRGRMHLITDSDSVGDTIALDSDIRRKEIEVVD